MLFRRWKTFYVLILSHLNGKRTLADKTVYKNGSIDTSYGPHPLSLDSTFKYTRTITALVEIIMPLGEKGGVWEAFGDKL
jgi:hypothetical protein